MNRKLAGVVGAVTTALVASVTVAAVPASAANGCESSNKDVLIWTDLDRGQAYKAWANTYNRTSTSICVTVIGKDGSVDKLATVADVDAPDLLLTAHDHIGQLQPTGKIQSFIMPNKAEFDARDKQACTAQGGGTYCLPMTVENIALFRNVKFAPKAPKTMADMLKVNDNFRKTHKTAKYTLGVSPGDAYHMYPLMSGLGGYVFGGHAGAWKPTDIGVANAKFLRNSTQIDTWYAKKLLNPNVTGSQSESDFIAGKIPYLITGPWNLDKLRLGNVNYEISAFPTIVPGIKSVPFYGVQGMYLTKWASPAKHNNKTAALTVLNALSKKDAQLALSSALVRTPANKKARASFTDEDSAAIAKAGAYAIPMPSISQMGLFWSNVATAWKPTVAKPKAAARFQAAQAAMKRGH